MFFILWPAVQIQIVEDIHFIYPFNVYIVVFPHVKITGISECAGFNRKYNYSGTHKYIVEKHVEDGNFTGGMVVNPEPEDDVEFDISKYIQRRMRMGRR